MVGELGVQQRVQRCAHGGEFLQGCGRQEDEVQRLVAAAVERDVIVDGCVHVLQLESLVTELI